jgi:hypothetical protein
MNLMPSTFFPLLVSLLLALPPLAQALEQNQDLSPAARQPLGAEPAFERDAAASAKQVTPEMEKKVRAFLDHFVDPNKSGAEMASLFAEDAQYYERGVVGKSEIALDVERYNRHWPYRAFHVSEISYMNLDPDSDGVFVAYTIDFEVANGVRAINGKANYAALISDLDGSPRVRAIKERVTRRKSILGLFGLDRD